MLASLQAEISEIAVLGQICTQNDIKCGRKVILTFQRELNKINEVYVCHLPHCSYLNHFHSIRAPQVCVFRVR